MNQIKFNTLLDLANILNWLIINEFIVDNNALWNERKDLWEKIIPDFYQNNEKFKKIVDFLFMFNRINFKILLMGCILFLNK